MDDLEFRKRALANPHDTDEVFLASAASNQTRTQLLRELQEMDKRISVIAHSVKAPSDLAERLRARTPKLAAPASRKFLGRYYAIAASLVIATGVIFSVGMRNASPSAADLEFRDNVMEHVYREASRYSSSTADVSLQQINAVLEEAGGHLRDDEGIKAMHIKFANDCNIAPAGRGAHIVLEGTKGSVSVIIIHNSPVTTKFDVNDPRYAGKIIPLGMGNLIIVGEKEEPLETYEALITNAFEWSI